MTNRSDAPDTEPTSRLWFIEETAETSSDPQLDSPQNTNNDSVIAGGTVEGSQTPQDAPAPAIVENATLVTPTTATDANLSLSTPADAAAVTGDPTEVIDTEVAADTGETVTEDDVEDETSADGDTVGDDLETTQVRRFSLMSPDEPSQENPELEEDNAADKAETEAVTEEATDESAKPEVAPEAPALAPAAAAAARRREPHKLDDVIFDGATALPSIPSRAPAHLWSLLLTLLLLPVGWYCAVDAVTRLLTDSVPPVSGGAPQIVDLAELAGAGVAIFITVLIARWSSLGTFVWGFVTTVLATAFLVLQSIDSPVIAQLNRIFAAMERSSVFFANVAHHLAATLAGGILLLAGIVLIALGFVSHGARRKGRRDYRAQRAIDSLSS